MYFSRPFNSIQPLPSETYKLTQVDVDPNLGSWITDCHSGRPQLQTAPAVLLILYTLDFKCKSESSHMQEVLDEQSTVMVLGPTVFSLNIVYYLMLKRLYNYKSIAHTKYTMELRFQITHP